MWIFFNLPGLNEMVFIDKSKAKPIHFHSN